MKMKNNTIWGLKNSMVFEAMDLTAGYVYGYYINKTGVKMKRRLKIRITEAGKVALSKPVTLRKEEYERIKTRDRLQKPSTFEGIAKMFIAGKDNTPSQT